MPNTRAGAGTGTPRGTCGCGAVIRREGCSIARLCARWAAVAGLNALGGLGGLVELGCGDWHGHDCQSQDLGGDRVVDGRWRRRCRTGGLWRVG